MAQRSGRQTVISRFVWPSYEQINEVRMKSRFDAGDDTRPNVLEAVSLSDFLHHFSQ